VNHDKTMKYGIRFLAILTLIIGLNYTKTDSTAALKTAINQLSNDPAMSAGQLGVCIMDTKTGEIISSYNSGKAMIPASTMKTVTTASALAILGENYRFKTTLEYDGIIENGILKGNLYLKGTGDPMLGSDEVKENELPKVANMEALLSTFLNEIRKKGITKIEGKIIGDDAYFNSTQLQPATWQWNDLGNYYGAGPSALNFHENLYYFYFKRSNVIGSQTSIGQVTPKLPYLTFQNEVTIGKKGTGDNAYIFGAPNTYNRYVRGTIPPGTKNFKIKGSIPNPAYFAAYFLMEKLEMNGIKTKKIATTELERIREGKKSTAERTIIYTHKSPMIKEIIARANEKSNNLYCEALLKAMGKKVKNIGTTEKGVEAVLEFWEGRGFDTKTFFMEDGSGLSARNAVSAFAMSSLMSKVARDKNLFPPFYNSLAIGGKSGTVRYLFRNNKAVGSRLRIKSGSIRRVRAYCGYATTKSGKIVSFSIMANNFSGKSTPIRQRMETIMLAIANLS
jgi:D-alanyl-D-alanine carboxypeptidase/D-alanyl-D-alanine-endopeptidase (penicillin-binding protein 4)